MKVSHSFKSLAIVVLLLSSISIHIPATKAEVMSIDQQLLNATDYIKNRYDTRIGLVSESEDTGSNVPDGTPCYRTFWVYSDNLWASYALKPFYPQIAENISRTIEPYIDLYGNSQLFEVVLGLKIPALIHAKSNINVATHTIDGLNYTVWTDRHGPEDGGIFYDADEYADLAFYLSLNYYLEGKLTASEELFRIGERMWRDYGFLDKAANQTGLFQNYKLGLYLFTVKATGFDSKIYDSVEEVAWSYQKENGGIAAQSFLNGTIYGTANVETTSALLLAYNGESIGKFHSQTSLALIIFLGIVILMAVLILIFIWTLC